MTCPIDSNDYHALKCRHDEVDPCARNACEQTQAQGTLLLLICPVHLSIVKRIVLLGLELMGNAYDIFNECSCSSQS